MTLSFGHCGEDAWPLRLPPPPVCRTLRTLEEDGYEDDYEERSGAFQRFQREVLLAERAQLLRLRNEGLINDEVMRRVERDLDLEEARLEL